MCDNTLVMSSLEFYGGESMNDAASRSVERWKGSAMAYVWGRQDASDSGRDTGYSQTFAEVYALANHITGGYAGPLQSAFHEWHDTGRLVVRQPNTRRVVQVADNGDAYAPRVEARLAVWAGGDYGSTYWPGLVKGINY
jgi:hypothetical protein